MHGIDQTVTAWPCPVCRLTWSSRQAAEDCCSDDAA